MDDNKIFIYACVWTLSSHGFSLNSSQYLKKTCNFFFLDEKFLSLQEHVVSNKQITYNIIILEKGFHGTSPSQTIWSSYLHHWLMQRDEAPWAGLSCLSIPALHSTPDKKQNFFSQLPVSPPQPLKHTSSPPLHLHGLLKSSASVARLQRCCPSSKDNTEDTPVPRKLTETVLNLTST